LNLLAFYFENWQECPKTYVTFPSTQNTTHHDTKLCLNLC
jgi:hypothetical protein